MPLVALFPAISSLPYLPGHWQFEIESAGIYR